MENKKSMYYNGNRLLSYNALFNFCMSNRGCGKTYFFKKWAIEDFKKSGYINQCVIVRRYKSDLKKFGQFFDDIKNEFPNDKLEVKGLKLYVNDQLLGWGIPLSTSTNERSTPYPYVNKIIYDEFILDTGCVRYISNEVEQFLELYSTIARHRDNVRVFFVANSISSSNPYFNYWKILVHDESKRFTKYRLGLIVVERFLNYEYVDFMYKTKFGQLIKGTKYGDYAVENKFLKDNKAFIRDNLRGGYVVGVFIYKNKYYTVFKNLDLDYIYVNENNCKDYLQRKNYVINREDSDENSIMIDRSHKISRLLRYYFEDSRFYFSSQIAKISFMDLLIRLI